MSSVSAVSDRERLRVGGESVLAELFSAHRERLERLIDFRLDPRVRSRLDASDVLQEAYLASARRIDEYVADPRVSFYVWVRQRTLQVMIDLQRQHFRQRRSPGREVPYPSASDSEATSFFIAQRLVDSMTSPSQVVSRREEFAWLKSALDSMNEIDREVLALRHFEQLTNRQVAEVLGLTQTAASNRYVRAATRLGEIVAELTPADSSSGG